MIKTLTFNAFADEFEKSGRKHSFSNLGKRLLFDYLEETDPDYDLDVVELDCEYTEYYIDDLLEEYGADDENDLTEVTIVAREGNTVIVTF